MHRTPDEASDETINRLFEDELKPALALKAAWERLEEAMNKPPENPKLNAETLANGRVNELWPGGPELPTSIPKSDLRAYDLDIDYASFRPEAERWRVIDLATFDGGPDAPGCFVGYGASEKEAKTKLLRMFAEYDAEKNEPKPKTVAPLLYAGPDEPNDYGTPRRVDDPDDVTFDDDLEDR